MKKNVIIAGVTRAGKSTMSRILSKKFGYQYVSMDAIVGAIETVFPEIGIHLWPSNSEEVVRIASEKITLFIKTMMERGAYDGYNLGMVVDVVQILPEHYVEYLSGKNCEIVYLLTSDVTPEERFDLHRKYDTKKDYTYEFTDKQMSNHCKYVVEWSKLLKEQCIKHGLIYFDTSKDREKVIEECIRFLSDNRS